jgi:hypothetical protein
MIDERFIITFRTLPDEVPPEIRLRRLLKLALRKFNFRCTAIEQHDQQNPTDNDESRHDGEGVGNGHPVKTSV